MISRPHVWVDKQSENTLLLLHGTGADEHDLLQLGELISPDHNLLSPRGLVSENGMNRFFERTPSGEFVQESVKQAVVDLVSFIEQAKDDYGFDAGNLFACGFSNGANTALATLMIRPEVLKSVVAFGATKPLNQSVENNLSGKRVFIANGERDPYAPQQITDAFAAELREAGADVSVLSHPGGHQISPAHIQQINRELT
jgi:phospholipase/carboxylesterase